MKLKFSKKGAELPLNAIVIALLVIIVLVVIIMFFMDQTADSGDRLDAIGGGVTDCAVGTYAISADKYSTAEMFSSCDTANGWERIYSVPKDDQGKVCCAKKGSSSSGSSSSSSSGSSSSTNSAIEDGAPGR